MTSKKTSVPCLACNPPDAEPGDYCDTHREELHRLDHQYEMLFRLQRSSRGKDYEMYHVFLRGDCDPCGRILVAETDTESLIVTVLLSDHVDLGARIADYDALKIERTYGDQLRDRIERDLIHSWYGNARACVDLFRILQDQPKHWDILPREQNVGEEEEESPEPHSQGGGKHSVH